MGEGMGGGMGGGMGREDGGGYGGGLKASGLHGNGPAEILPFGHSPGLPFWRPWYENRCFPKEIMTWQA